MYTINLFGPPEILWQGQPIRIIRRQQRLILYCLVASPQPVARQFLAHLFWPKEPDWRAQRLLTRQLSALRASLPDSRLLLVSQDYVGIDPNLANVDLWQIDAASQPYNLPGPTNSSNLLETISQIEAAVTSYRGPLLSGVDLAGYPELELWVSGQQPKWEQRILSLLEQLVDYFMGQAHWHCAIAYARNALEIDQANEAIHRKLIELYAASDQRTAALRQYEHCLTALAALDLQPSPATDRAFEEACKGLVKITQ
ncbi:MAG: BTAD domain-containing putative transcriptional regulator [Chloroflexota bacterium]